MTSAHPLQRRFGGAGDAGILGFSLAIATGFSAYGLVTAWWFARKCGRHCPDVPDHGSASPERSWRPQAGALT